MRAILQTSKSDNSLPRGVDGELLWRSDIIKVRWKLNRSHSIYASHRPWWQMLRTERRADRQAVRPQTFCLNPFFFRDVSRGLLLSHTRFKRHHNTRNDMEVEVGFPFNKIFHFRDWLKRNDFFSAQGLIFDVMCYIFSRQAERSDSWSRHTARNTVKPLNDGKLSSHEKIPSLRGFRLWEVSLIKACCLLIHPI